LSRVLVTGGRGAIGAGLMTALDPAAWEAIPLGRDDGDLLEPGNAERLIAEHRPGALVHLAWSSRGRGYASAAANHEWLEASERLLVAFAAAGGGRVVVAGTCAEYDAGGLEGRSAMPESAPLVPLEGPRAESERYAWAKRSLEERAGRIAGLELAWARIFFVFSRRDEPGRLLGDLLAARESGFPAEIRAGGLVRDYLPATAAGAALAAVLDSGLTGPVNVGSGRGTTISELAAAAAERLGLSPELVLDRGPAPAGPPASIVADISRLRAETGWEPPASIAEALALELDGGA
jgi:nucleoside-diphosphate-sugar epimerase